MDSEDKTERHWQERLAPTSQSNQLSAEDLAVIETFHKMEKLPGESPLPSQVPSEPSTTSHISSSQNFFSNDAFDDMLTLFATEAGEDIAAMRRALTDLEQDDNVDSPGFGMIQRIAHKIKGTAGSMGCDNMSTIAYYIEMTVKRVKSGAIAYLAGVITLVHAIHALEMTLEGVVTAGRESTNPLADLVDAYEALSENVNLPPFVEKTSYEEKANLNIAPQHSQNTPPMRHRSEAGLPITVRVDEHRLKDLVQHSDQLAELRTPLESAQQEVEAAFHVLDAAQARLRRLEALLSTTPFSSQEVGGGEVVHADHSVSSLVARILSESVQRTGHITSRRNKSLTQPTGLPEVELWDEMEINRFTESNALVVSLSEAIADIATASSQLRLAFTHLNSVVQQHVTQASLVRGDALLLQCAPLATLTTPLQQAIHMIAKVEKQQISFEVVGETTLMDAKTLEELTGPLLQLVQTCIAGNSIISRKPEQNGLPCRVWLHGYGVGDEVTIEIGFSREVQGGVLDAMRELIVHLNGSISVERNTAGGISFQFHFARSHGTVHGLLVRGGQQRAIIPFFQVQRIDPGQQAHSPSLSSLAGLLGSPGSGHPQPGTAGPVLLLHPGPSNVGVQVDEILGEVEMVMKPLAAHLQRPGIIGTAIDGLGDMLLVLNLSELIRQRNKRSRSSTTKPLATGINFQPEQGQRKVLIADDSVSIRQSLYQTLTRAGYAVMEAHDGMEAFEELLEKRADILVLDIEMPNLNGYDLLSIIRGKPELAGLKIVMLTSRSSEKHQQRAFELGAHAYLIKPCPQDTLLETLRSLITNH